MLLCLLKGAMKQHFSGWLKHGRQARAASATAARALRFSPGAGRQQTAAAVAFRQAATLCTATPDTGGGMSQRRGFSGTHLKSLKASTTFWGTGLAGRRGCCGWYTCTEAHSTWRLFAAWCKDVRLTARCSLPQCCLLFTNHLRGAYLIPNQALRLVHRQRRAHFILQWGRRRVLHAHTVRTRGQTLHALAHPLRMGPCMHTPV